MGTFTGHLVPGLAFTLLGLWHTLNTISSYKLRGQSGFTATTWYPVFSHLPLVKYLELLLLLAFSALAMSMQLLDLPLLRLSYTPDGLEHAAMFFHLSVYASAALVAELSSCPPAGALHGLVGVLAANVFAQELFLLHFHSTDHVGVEGHYHWLLQVVVTASFLSAVITAGVPGSFPAALVRSMSVMFQGVWFMVMGFALWVPQLVPEGCHPSAGGGLQGGVSGAITCGTVEADARARMLGNLQFSWVFAGISIFTASLCQRHGGDGMAYRQLVAAGVDVQLNSGREDELKQVGV
ncbi:hypothetical protein Taro_044023 [Colocasia esculenta]|uniref:Transmembrane protein 45B n=1 Tax=Colocasia esculenta TaxID=4460 RepID=A0A843WI01_COLES|nr:hypothetical protein [Colocasia esculenta]